MFFPLQFHFNAMQNKSNALTFQSFLVFNSSYTTCGSCVIGKNPLFYFIADCLLAWSNLEVSILRTVVFLFQFSIIINAENLIWTLSKIKKKFYFKEVKLLFLGPLRFSFMTGKHFTVVIVMQNKMHLIWYSSFLTFILVCPSFTVSKNA